MKNILMRAVMCVTIGAALAASMTVRAEDSVMVAIPCTQKDASGSCIKWGAIVRGCKSPCTAEVSQGGDTQRTIVTQPAGLPVNAIMKLN